jgi:hypothetical protein
MTFAERLNRLYDRATSRAALETAHQPPTGTVDDLHGHKYCLLITYRKDGEPAANPLWFGIHAGRLYFRTGAASAKLRRLRRTAEVRIAPCRARGQALRPPFLGSARVVEPGEEADAERWIQANYGAGRALYECLLARRVPAVYVEVTPR